jgi:hypothetical protein
MRSALMTSALALSTLFLVSASSARAQYGPIYRPGLYPYGTPGLSPYLDLTRGGNRAANYFLGTIPEIERRQNTAVFGAAILDLERRNVPVEPTAEELVPTLPSTGHPVGFMTYYPYYVIGPQPAQPARQQPAQRRTR